MGMAVEAAFDRQTLSLPSVPPPSSVQLRKERAEFKPDDRFLHVVNMIRTGQFGWADCECGVGCQAAQAWHEHSLHGRGGARL